MFVVVLRSVRHRDSENEEGVLLGLWEHRNVENT